jgi:mannose PTS system EIID component
MKPFPARVRIRMLLRSFAIQGSWNYETLIGTGFAYTLLPALRFVYGEGNDRLEAAVARHIELFNSHPYLATVAVGAVSRLEAEGAEPIVIQRFKTALRGSLGSLGDRLVWTTWRPMAVLLGLVLLLAGAAWWVAVVMFLLVYNAMHIGVRTLGLKLGAAGGLEVGRSLRDIPFQVVIDTASRFACFLVGIGVVLAAAPAMRDPVAATVTAIAILLGLRFGAHMRRAMMALLVIVAVIALVFGLIGYGA